MVIRCISLALWGISSIEALRPATRARMRRPECRLTGQMPRRVIPPGNIAATASSTSNRPALKGELSVDLSDAAPQYRFNGRVEGFAFKGGKLDFEGRVDAAARGSPAGQSACGGNTERPFHRVFARSGFPERERAFSSVDAGNFVRVEV